MSMSMFRRLSSAGIGSVPPLSLPHSARYAHSSYGVPLLMVTAPAAELMDIEVEHVARLLNAEDGVIADAVVKHVDRSSDPGSLVLQPTIRVFPVPVAVEVDMSSRWRYSLPRRGGTLPGIRPLCAPTPLVDANRSERPVRLNPFTTWRPKRPCAPPTPDRKVNLVNDAHPERLPLVACDLGLREWQAWELATVVTMAIEIVHRWQISMKLQSHPALPQPFHVLAPVGGRYERSANLRPGQAIAAGELIGRVLIDPAWAQQVRAAAASNRGNDKLRHTGLPTHGIEPDIVDEILANPMSAIDITAPISGIVDGSIDAIDVRAGQTLVTLKVPAHTMAYGQLVGQEPLPQRVELCLKLGPTQVTGTGLPLVERSTSRRTFAIPLPVNLPGDGAVWTIADLVNERPSGSAIAVPKDAVMQIGKSTDVLLHSGVLQVTRKPVNILHQEGDLLFLDPASLPVGVAVVRDIKAVAASFPKVAAIMTGLMLC